MSTNSAHANVRDLATELRQWADECRLQASNPRIDPSERERLLKMQTSLLELARNEDWLDGKTQ
jgi:hypothetical protein